VIHVVVDGATVHTYYHNDTDASHNNLKHLAILNIAKREPDTQPTENCDGDIVHPRVFVVKETLRVIHNERNALVQTLSTCDVLETQHAIHIDNKNDHNGDFRPRLGDPLCHNAKFNFLPDIKFLLLHLGVSIIECFFLLWFAVALLIKK
jgi:hypothetical protein